MRLSKINIFLCSVAGMLGVFNLSALVDVVGLHGEFDVVANKARATDRPLVERVAAINRAIEIVDLLRGEHLNSYSTVVFQGFAFGDVFIDERVGTNAKIKSTLDEIKRKLEAFRISISGVTAAAPAHDEHERILALQRRLAEFAARETVARRKNLELRAGLDDISHMLSEGGR